VEKKVALIQVYFIGNFPLYHICPVVWVLVVWWPVHQSSGSRTQNE